MPTKFVSTALQIDRDARLGQAFGQSPGASMVVGEAVDVVVERVQRGRGDHTGLPHGAPEQELLPPGPLDPFLRRGEDGAERAAEPLGEADGDAVGEPPVLGGGDAACGGRVHDPRAVEVHGEPKVARGLRRRGKLVEGPDASAGAAVVCSRTTMLAGSTSSLRETTSWICSRVMRPFAPGRPTITRPE